MTLSLLRKELSVAKWQNISDILTPEGIDKLQPGHILRFNFEGSINEYKVMRIYKGKVWVKQARTYHPDEVQITDSKKVFEDG